jgi:16S rRNA U516 pseudouridylate synthase RsuA-like enzyme
MNTGGALDLDRAPVRRMTARVGYPTRRLLRAAIGGVCAEGLAPGQWLEIAPDTLWSPQ